MAYHPERDAIWWSKTLACQLLSITGTLLYNLAQFETTDLQAAKAVLEELGKKGVSHDDDA